MERLIREHCQIDGDDLINYRGIITCTYVGRVYYYYEIVPPPPPKNFLLCRHPLALWKLIFPIKAHLTIYPYFDYSTIHIKITDFVQSISEAYTALDPGHN